MVYQMSIPMVPAAGQQAQRAWGVGAVRGEAGGARARHRDQVVPAEILMIQAAGPVNIAPFQMSSRPPSARCATNGGEARVLCK
jgi:hypothetical protein